MLGIVENNKASLLENANHPLSAKTAYEKSIQYYQKGNMHKRLPNVYNNLGYVYYTLNDLPMQAYCYRKALFICDSLSLPQIYRNNSYFALAFCYVQLKNYPQAHYYLNKTYPQINNVSSK